MYNVTIGQLKSILKAGGMSDAQIRELRFHKDQQDLLVAHNGKDIRFESGCLDPAINKHNPLEFRKAHAQKVVALIIARLDL